MFAETPIEPAVRGWCPSAYAPMETGDGWIVRARIGCRPVSAVQWSELAEIASAFGNGQVEFTMRGNVQVRGVAEHETNDAAHRLVAVGLAGFDAADDRRRVVVVNPLNRLAVDSDTEVTPSEVVAYVEDLLALHGDKVPSKWWAIVDADSAWPMAAAGCDVALQQRSGTWRMLVAGREVWSGPDPRSEVTGVVEQCAELRCRARDLDQTGAPLAQADQRRSWSGVQEIGGSLVAAVSPPFGVTNAPALRVLATVAATRGVSVHPTPERGVVVVAPEECRAELDRCLDELRQQGWIIEADDPRRLVSTCIGTHGCAASLIDTWQVATDLIVSTGVTERVHVSGCSKRCGAPAGVRELVATSVGIEAFAALGMEEQ